MIFAYICKDILLDLAKKPSIAVQQAQRRRPHNFGTDGIKTHLSQIFLSMQFVYIFSKTMQKE